MKQTWLRLCVPPVWRLSRVDSLWLGHLRTKKEKKESEVAQLCPTLCDPTDCGLPGPSVRRIFQVRILEWVVSSFSRGESSPGGSDGKASACNEGDPGSIPGLGRYPREENGNSFQYSWLEKSHGWRSLVGYSPCGCKESDMTERLHVLSLFFLFSRGIEPGSLALQVDSLLTMPPVWQDTKSSTHKYPSSHYPMHQERGKE